MFPIASQILGNNGFVRNKMIKYQRLSCKSNNFKFVNGVRRSWNNGRDTKVEGNQEWGER